MVIDSCILNGHTTYARFQLHAQNQQLRIHLRPVSRISAELSIRILHSWELNQREKSLMPRIKPLFISRVLSEVANLRNGIKDQIYSGGTLRR